MVDVGAVLNGLKEYDVGISGMGRPKVAPLPIDLNDPYAISIKCRISTKLRSMSGVHEESPYFGSEIDEPIDDRRFTDPHTGQLIRKKGAGCTRFYIEFHLGKSLFPQLIGGDVNILHPDVVKYAKSTFKVPLAQGFHWG